VGCTKSHVAKAYKALAAAAQPGGLLAGLAWLPPVKQSVCLALAPQTACSILCEAVRAALLGRGWIALRDNTLIGRYAESKICRDKLLRISGPHAVWCALAQAAASWRQLRATCGLAWQSSSRFTCSRHTRSRSLRNQVTPCAGRTSVPA